MWEGLNGQSNLEGEMRSATHIPTLIPHSPHTCSYTLTHLHSLLTVLTLAHLHTCTCTHSSHSSHLHFHQPSGNSKLQVGELLTLKDRPGRENEVPENEVQEEEIQQDCIWEN